MYPSRKSSSYTDRESLIYSEHRSSFTRRWTSMLIKMIPFRAIRSVFFNIILFVLGIFLTLVIVSHRDESSIVVCEPTVAVNPTDGKSSLHHVLPRFEPAVQADTVGSGNLHSQRYLSRDKSASNKTVNNGSNDPLPTALATSGLSAEGVTSAPHTLEGPVYFDTSVSANKLRLPFSSQVKRNLVYVVTPTYNRPEQIPELTRVAQALLQVNHLIHWVVVQDVDNQTPELESFLNKFNINFSLLKSVKPNVFNKVVGKPRGVGARRAALEWLRFHQLPGVVYFADDDNTYDSDIFRQMHRTKRVSMWPVGLVTELGVSSPIVKNGKVIGFYDGWKAYRKFPVDMAGFAVNLKLIHAKKEANMPWVAGYEEDELLQSLGITLSDIQPLANNCTEILVWHTKSAKNNWAKRARNLDTSVEKTTNLNALLKRLPKSSLGRGNHGGPGPAKNTESEPGFSIMNFLFGSIVVGIAISVHIQSRESASVKKIKETPNGIFLAR